MASVSFAKLATTYGDEVMHIAPTKGTLAVTTGNALEVRILQGHYADKTALLADLDVLTNFIKTTDVPITL